MSCGLFQFAKLPVTEPSAVFLFGWIVSTLPPSGHGAILQATLRIRGNVIRSQDDWEFAGPDLPAMRTARLGLAAARRQRPRPIVFGRKAQ